MTAYYDPSLPTAKDRARYILSDTHDHPAIAEVENPALYDETIESMLAKFPFNEAVRQLAIGLITKFSHDPVKYDEENGITVDWTGRLEVWENLINRLSSVSDENVHRPGIAVGKLTNPTLTKMRTY
jgi:hypothetical protein